VAKTSNIELQEEPFGGLVDVWLALCASSFSVLAIYGFSAWSNMTEPTYSTLWWVLFLKTAIAGATELRFCLGHRNYLRRVLEEQKLQGSIQWERANWDFMLMCLLTICKLTMAIKLSDSATFINAFLCLMLCDLLWLVFEPRVRSVGNIVAFKPCRWMWINLATAILILVGSRFQPISAVELCAMGTIWQLLIAAVNSLLDLCCISGPVVFCHRP